MSLFNELQRRSVFKVAAAYLVVAWLVVQAASIAFPLFEAPTWALRVFVFVVALGFPLALVIAWAVELTPEGLKLEPAPTGNKRMYAIAGVFATLALVWFYRADLFTKQDAAPTVAQSPRLAVLPLSNFSPDPANAFFADGLHDDMLTALSRMQGVEVISRTTMQTFRDSKLTLAEIAAKIGATQVLEGSVRRDATRVRLTVQLIDARSDDHIWAETYDRSLADALTLQNEVAQGVAKAMKVAIAGGAEDAPLTAVPAAYDLYLKARVTRNNGDRLKLLDSTLLLDPKFTEARAHRGRTACQVQWFDETRSAELVPQARADIDQARAERPDLPAIDVAEAFYRYYVGRDWTAALAMADAALAKDPSNSDALLVRSLLLRRLGRRDEAIATAQRRLELDPASVSALNLVFDHDHFYGRYRDAFAQIDAFLSRMPPDDPDRDGLDRFRNYIVYLIDGDLEGIRRRVEALRPKMTEAQYVGARFTFGDPSPERIAWLQSRGEPWQKADEGALYPTALDVAREADYLGDAKLRDAALDEAARLYATLPQKVMDRPYTLAHHARFLALRGDRAGTLADVDRMLALTTPDKDATATGPIGMFGAQALARVGETARALDLLEASIWLPGVHPTLIYHDAVWRKLLGAEPRYQALMKQIETRFEKL
jgi:TolB-like protein